MKRKIFLSIILLCLGIITFGAVNVSAELYGDFYYSIDNGKACITGYKGTTRNLTIPAKINGYPVVIGDNAFRRCDSLSKVTISEGITSIGDYAFWDSSVGEVVIPKTITHMGDGAFGFCSNMVGVYITDLAAWCRIDFEDDTSNPLYGAIHFYLNGKVMYDIIIPEGVESIGKYAFIGLEEPIPLDQVRTVTIPKSVKYIGCDAFSYIKDLQKVNITDFAAWCRIEFENGGSNPLCSAPDLCLNGRRIWDLIIPEEITSIGNYTFYNYAKSGNITLHNKVTSIGDYAFYGCGITNMTIPDSVTFFGEHAFDNCSDLTYINITNLEKWFNLTFETETCNPLYYVKNLYVNGSPVTNLTIPDGITVIGEYAFYNCTGLESVTIPDSITGIGKMAFYGCTGLKSLNLSGNSAVIGESVFHNCTALTDVTISGNIKSIGSYSFYYCNKLKMVNINNIRDWCAIEFRDNYSNPVYYSNNLYLDGSPVKDLIIPEGVTRIGERAFFCYKQLTSVTLPDSLSSVGSYAFYGCSNLTNVNIKDIKEWCDIEFENSANPLSNSKCCLNGTPVTEVRIPDGITRIGSGAFEECKTLTKVTIPDSVTSIGKNAFSSCSSLTGIKIPEDVTSIDDYTFYSCNMLYIIIPKNVTSISSSAFFFCDELKTVLYTGTEEEWKKIELNDNKPLINAFKIYNATIKSYKFETNCAEKLSDITEYGIFESPVIFNNDKIFLGWYDNEALLGTPVTFPYFGDATTLYASWKDRTGTDFDDALIAHANQVNTSELSEQEQVVYYKYVPSESIEHKICTTGDKDTIGYLYNSKKTLIQSNDNDGEDNNFSITYTLTAGETYYIAVKLNNETGEVNLMVEYPTEYSIDFINVKNSAGESVNLIPQELFSFEVGVTNNYSKKIPLNIIACYTSDNKLKMVKLCAEEILPGQTVPNVIYVDNSEGDICKIKVFIWDSDTLSPICKTVFPV